MGRCSTQASVAAGSSVPAGLTFDTASGNVDVAAGTPAGTYSFDYEICEALNPSNCEVATITVSVDAAAIVADPDSVSGVNGATGASGVADVLDGDTLNGAPATLADVDISVVAAATPNNPGDPVPTLNPATGLVDVPAGTPAGTYTINYEICETLNPANCANTSVTVVVAAPAIAATADDAGSVTTASGGSNLINALNHDTLNGIAVNLSEIDLTVTSPASNPGVTLNTVTGEVSVAPGAPAGNYSIGYQICETLNPANCATATIAVAVTASPIGAANDTPAPINGTDGNPTAINAFDNDTLNGAPVNPADITATITTPASNPGVVMDPSTGNVSVAPGTPAGTYTIAYEICETLNPTNCAVSTVTVIVDAAPIAATPDTPPAVNGTDGNPSVTNAFDNDTLNGTPVDPADITATITTPASHPGVVMDPVTGIVSVAPGTPAGPYTIEYEICETLNPANCATSTVTINVDAAPISATNDDAGSLSGITGGSDIINALVNDSLNGQPVDPSLVDLTVTSPASNPGVTLDTATGLVSVASGTPAGTYSIGYQICETLNPSNCATATVIVVVEAAPIAASPDTPAPVNGADGGDDVINAFDNDTLNGAPVDPADITATITTPAAPLTPGASVPVMDPGTGLVDVPAGTPAGTYVIEYEICEDLNPANCATSNVTIIVEAPAITAADDNPPFVREGIGNPNAINAFHNDTLNGVPFDPAAITATVITPASDPGVVMDPATGNVSVAPNVPAGTYTIVYEICETLNPANCATSTVNITVEAPISAIEGTVFTDMDGDRVVDPDDIRRAGWIVEVMYDGDMVASAITDSNGDYRVENLASGPGYSVRFRNPDNNVVYDIIADINLGANTTVVDQNLPIDPSGVIYDSITRAPVSGVTATLTDAGGNPLPAVCFLDPSQANQVTGATGEYRFDIIPGAAAQCPTAETVYNIRITPPAGYSDSSSVLAPQPGPFDPTGLAAPVRINSAPTAPTEANPPYYLTFRLADGDPDIINNHIPIDPFLTRTPLVVTKTSVKRSASVGDIVPYEITVRNTENAQRSDVTVTDILPAGMKYVLGTASVNGAAQEPVNTGRRVTWNGQVIPANGSSQYNLTLVVGAGVTGGEKVNTAVAENGTTGEAISNRGTAVVAITPSAIFDCSEMLGKVFEDANRNGYQDKGEPGVPGVRLATVNGQLITTDEFGRYHIACAAVPDARIGSNFVLKVDTRTLPLGWDTTTDNPRSIRLTRGKFGELNFGVAPKEQRMISPGNNPANGKEKGE